MGLRPTHRDENRIKPAAVGWMRCGTVKAVCARDELRPFLSVTWNTRFEPMSVTPPVPAGRVVVRDGA